MSRQIVVNAVDFDVEMDATLRTYRREQLRLELSVKASCKDRYNVVLTSAVAPGGPGPGRPRPLRRAGRPAAAAVPRGGAACRAHAVVTVVACNSGP